MRVLVLGAGADSSSGAPSASTEALLALKAAGAEVVLLDSNPATLATDPEVAHRTYLEPVTLEAASRILALERPDAVISTFGGERALALARQLVAEGLLGKARLLGVSAEGLARAGQLNAAVDVPALAGWRQAELLVLADAQTARVVGTVELAEPVGIDPHDSLAVTPAQSFGPAVLQQLESSALAVMREVCLLGLGSVRLGVHPTDGRVALLELGLALPAHTSLVTRASGRRLAAEAAGLLLGQPLEPDGLRRGAGVAVRAPRFEAGGTCGANGRPRSFGEVVALGAQLGEALLRADHALEGAPSGSWQRALAGDEAAAAQAGLGAELRLVAAQAQRLAAFRTLEAVPEAELRLAKAEGFSDAKLARLWNCAEDAVRARRHAGNLRPTLRAQGEVWTLRYDALGERAEGADRPTVLLLGGGARRIGQGGELEWSCAHASRALQAAGMRVVLLDCTAAPSPAQFDQVCLGALAQEEVLELCALLKPVGVLAQFGGRAALSLAAAGVPVLGTAAADLERALDRGQLAAVVDGLGLLQPPRRMADNLAQARQAAADLGYPLVARTASGTTLVQSERELVPGDLEKFLAEATEADVALLRDKTGRVLIAGVLEHVEQAGIHSGDAALSLPPHSLSPEVVERVKDAATVLAGALQVIGLLDVRFAVQGKAVFVLEANPRVARTVPFVAKATGLQLVELAASLALGATLEELGCTREPSFGHVAVKEAVFPFARFPDSDVALGPQMKSTGEVMGLSESVAVAFGKSQLAAGTALPRTGRVFLSVQDDDKPAVVDLARRLKALGFTLLTTEGTHGYLSAKRVDSERVRKVRDGGTHIGGRVREGEVALLINTVDADPDNAQDSLALRREAVARGVPYFTTVEAARLAVAALEAQASGERQYRPLQDWLSKR